MTRHASSLATLLSLATAFASTAAAVPEKPDGRAQMLAYQRVLFIGDEITYDGRYVADIAAYFAIRRPEKPFVIVNAGVPGETLSGLSESGFADGRHTRPDLHDRLGRLLDAVIPGAVFACYGTNDGLYQPFDEQRFTRFKEAVMWLNDELAKRRTPLVFLTPPVFDEKRGGHAGYRDVMEKYSLWMLDQRPTLKVIDVNGATSIELDRRRENDPTFTFARDGIHPDDIGHWIIAREVLRQLGGKEVAKMRSVEEMAAMSPNGPQLCRLMRQQQLLMRDAWLDYVGHTNPDVHGGMNLQEARGLYDKLQEQIHNLAQPAAQTLPIVSATRPAKG